MAANSARTNASPDHKNARHPAAISREAPGLSMLGDDLEAAPIAAGRDPIDVVASLPAAPPEVRARVMGQLQRVLGNDYVQRVVRRTRADRSGPALARIASPAADPTTLRRAPTATDTSTAPQVGASVATPVASASGAGGPTPDPDADPLSDDEVKQAIDYYVKQPWLFPTALIKKLQARLSVDETGVADEATVQAVARFQLQFATGNAPLKADGKAGPRTMPLLFPSGLADEKHEQSYVKAARGVFDDWVKLKDAKGRALALVKKVNHELVDAGVPPVNEVVTKLSGGADGEFDAENWIMLIDKENFSQETIDDQRAAEMVDTVYHEARHAEQSFQMARLEAAHGKSAKDIADEMSIPARIAQAAKNKPLRLGTPEAVEAQGWFDETYGSGAAKTNQVYMTLSKRDGELKRAEKANQDHPSPANQAKLDEAQKKYDEAYAAYQNLSAENDAFHVGDRAQDEYLKESKP